MSQPSEQPEWASGGSAKLADPTAGKKAIGWVRKEKPASEILNWWQNLVYLWILWLSGFFDSSGDLILPTNSYAKVSGTGKYKRGTLVRKYGAFEGVIPTKAGSTNHATFGDGSGDGDSDGLLPNHILFASGVSPSGTNFQQWVLTPLLQEGERITKIQARVFGDTTGQLLARLYKMQDGTPTLLIATASSATSATWQTLVDDGSVTETVGSDPSIYYYLQVYQIIGATTTSTMKLSGVQITTDVP